MSLSSSSNPSARLSWCVGYAALVFIVK
jgi:hypothetical protein